MFQKSLIYFKNCKCYLNYFWSVTKVDRIYLAVNLDLSLFQKWYRQLNSTSRHCIAYCIAHCIAYCIAYCIAFCIAYCIAYCIAPAWYRLVLSDQSQRNQAGPGPVNPGTEPTGSHTLRTLKTRALWLFIVWTETIGGDTIGGDTIGNTIGNTIVKNIC